MFQMCVNKAKNLTIIITTKTIISCGEGELLHHYSMEAGAGGSWLAQHTIKHIHHPSTSSQFVANVKRRLINWIIVSFHPPQRCWLQAAKKLSLFGVGGWLRWHSQLIIILVFSSCFYRHHPMDACMLLSCWKRVRRRSPTGRVWAWAGRFVAIFLGIYRNFVLSHNLITWCPASFRPSTHSLFDDWVSHLSLFLSLSRFLNHCGGVCMCFEFLWFYYPLF